MNANELAAMRQYLMTDRSIWEGRWDDVIDWIMPDRRPIGSKNSNPDPADTEHLLDATGVDANQRLASNMSAMLSSKSVKWVSLKWRDRENENRKEAREALASLENQIYRNFGSSNFYREIATYWADVSSFSSAGLYFENFQNTGRYRFDAVPISSMAISPDEFHNPLFVFRHRNLTALNIERKWPGAKDKVSELGKVIEKEPYREFEVVHAVGPADHMRPADGRNRFFSAYYMQDKKDHVILNDSNGTEGYRTMPYMLGRWNRIPEETYGSGPGLRTLSDVKTLNRLIYYKDQAIPLAILPPLLTTEDSIVSIGAKGELEPGATIVRRADGQVEFLTPQSRFQVAELEAEEMRQKVRQQFYYNDLLLHPDRPEMTKEEVIRRLEIAQRLFMSTVELYEEDVLDRVLDRAIQITVDAHPEVLAPFPPDLRPLVRGNLRDAVEIVYTGPLARAQNLPEVLADQDLATQVVTIAGQFQRPDLMQIIDWHSYFEKQAIKTGASPEILASRAEFDKIKQQYLDSMRQMAEAQAAREQASAFQSAARGASEMQKAGGTGPAAGGAR